MATPQPGIFHEGLIHHWFLQFRITGEPSRELETLIGSLRRIAVGGGECVVAYGPDLARSWLGDACPVELEPFATVDGTIKAAPSTQDDLFVWLASDDLSRNFDRARSFKGELHQFDGVAVAHETQGFVYADSRDLTGFVDGTANPEGDERPGVALVGDDRVGAGGSFVIAQRWIHDLDRFARLDESDQEKVVGRTKPDSIELADKPDDSHVGRVEIEEDGEELPIYRRSVPYVAREEAGLFFLGFSGHRTIFDKMLAAMFGTADGVHDRLTEFTTPVTGSYYFAPPLESLPD